MGHDGLAAAIFPVHTPFDGDTVFCVSVGTVAGDPLLVERVGTSLVAEAIREGSARRWVPMDCQRPGRLRADASDFKCFLPTRFGTFPRGQAVLRMQRFRITKTMRMFLPVGESLFKKIREEVWSVIRLLLADDHPLTRSGIAAYLEKEQDMALVGEAGDGEEAWEKIRALKPHVALLDIRMPKEDGVAVARKIKEARLPVIPLMLTSYDAQQYVVASLRAGAKGYVLKTATPEELTRAVRVVAGGGIYLDSEVSRSMEGGDFTPEPLSTREREVLLLAAKGHSSKEVAQELFISDRTVQTHLASIYDKLGAKNKTEAMLLALKYGIVTMEELLE
jgi:DNA-binding NarL/FixJ family response regulator